MQVPLPEDDGRLQVVAASCTPELLPRRRRRTDAVCRQSAVVVIGGHFQLQFQHPVQCKSKSNMTAVVTTLYKHTHTQQFSTTTLLYKITIPHCALCVCVCVCVCVLLRTCGGPFHSHQRV